MVLGGGIREVKGEILPERRFEFELFVQSDSIDEIL